MLASEDGYIAHAHFLILIINQLLSIVFNLLREILRLNQSVNVALAANAAVGQSNETRL